MKFKPRSSTDLLVIVTKDTHGMTLRELQVEAKRSGELDFQYHYYVTKEGTVEQGRESYVVGHYSLEKPESTITILVDAKSLSKLADAQAFSLDLLVSSIQGEYPDIQIEKER
jgi:hypothetical protein